MLLCSTWPSPLRGQQQPVLSSSFKWPWLSHGNPKSVSSSWDHRSWECAKGRGSFRLWFPTLLMSPEVAWKTTPISAFDARQLSTHGNKEAGAISHPVWAHTLTWFLCWPFKPPGPSWGSGDKSKSLEQGTWEAERRQVRTIRRDRRPSQQTAVVVVAGARHIRDSLPADYLPSLPGALEPSCGLSAKTNLVPMISSCRTAPGPHSALGNIILTRWKVDVTAGPIM